MHIFSLIKFLKFAFKMAILSVTAGEGYSLCQTGFQQVKLALKCQSDAKWNTENPFDFWRIYWADVWSKVILFDAEQKIPGRQNEHSVRPLAISLGKLLWPLFVSLISMSLAKIPLFWSSLSILPISCPFYQSWWWRQTTQEKGAAAHPLFLRFIIFHLLDAQQGFSLLESGVLALWCHSCVA